MKSGKQGEGYTPSRNRVLPPYFGAELFDFSKHKKSPIAVVFLMHKKASENSIEIHQVSTRGY
jgi:hypothetical protein